MYSMFVAYNWVYYKVFIILFFIVRNVCFTLLLWTQGYDKWWLGLIPFGHYYAKRECGVLWLPLIIPQILLSIATYAFMDTTCLILWVVLSIISNCRFAYIFLAYNNWLYALVPFYKYYVSIKEVWLYCKN